MGVPRGTVHVSRTRRRTRPRKRLQGPGSAADRTAAPSSILGTVAAPTYQETILALERFWADYGCVILQPYHTEVGAGTFNPATFLRCLGPEPWKAAYVEPSLRPSDGRYGENPYRFQQFWQYQVVLKPTPDDVLDVYFESLGTLGIDPVRHDVRLVEDDWEGPTLGASGLGWEVWIDGLEVTQFTYFQQLGSLDLDLITAEIVYGTERLAMFLQGKTSAFDLEWAPGVTWGDVYRENERQWSVYNFEQADVSLLTRRFEEHERDCERLLEARLPIPAYDEVLKCSHAFNLLDARGAISVTERAAYIARVRNLARRVALAYLEPRRPGEAAAEEKSPAHAAA
jgi:glycyl-tRNA synthetase alpha chain